MYYTKKLIAIVLIAVLMLSIVPVGAVEPIEPAAIEDVSDPNPLENPAPMEQQATEQPPAPTEQTTPPTEAPPPVEQPPLEEPVPTEAPAPVTTDFPTEQPVITEQPTATEEPTTAPVVDEPTPTEAPTQEPLPSPTEPTNIVDKTGWEYAPQKMEYNVSEIGLGNSFQVSLYTLSIGGVGKYTFAYYIYNGDTIVQKTAYSKNLTYVYTPKTVGTYRAVAFVKNGNGEVRTITSKSKVTVVETANPLQVSVKVKGEANITLGDKIEFNIISRYGATDKYHLHTYYVYKNNAVVEKFPYKAAESEYYYYGDAEYHSTVFYTPKSPGNYKFVVFAKDSLGVIKLCSTDEYLVSQSPLYINARVENKNYDVDDVVNVYSEATGGTGSYQYAYYVYKNNAIIQRVWYTANAVFKYTPKSEGTYKVQAFVKDGLGNVKWDLTEEFFVSSAPLSAFGGMDLYDCPPGIFCYGGGLGGVKPYTYAYYIYKNDTILKKIPYSDADSIDYSPKDSGTYKLIVFVKDAAGTIRTATYEVEFDNDLVLMSAPKIQNSIDLGNVINISADVRYGQGFYQYAYYIYKDGALLEKLPYTNNAKLAYKPKSTGIYKVLMFIKDEYGKIVYGFSNNCEVYRATELTLKEVYMNVHNELTYQPITVTVQCYGGIKPYQFAYYIYKDDNIIKKTNYNYVGDVEKGYFRFNFIPTSPGAYKVRAFIKDSVGTIAYDTSYFCNVTEGDEETGIYAGLENCGTYLNMNLQVSGDFYPYQYAYYVYKNETRVKTTAYAPYTDIVDIPYNISESGTYKFVIFVKDKYGNIETYTTNSETVETLDTVFIKGFCFEQDSAYVGESVSTYLTIENVQGAKVAY
ncbi:MAG: hypothetical protein GYA87_09340, partial [Christensenellaceae bacterium]|nr:hypothetical protein [Christensenellaceae bacterium]